MDRRTFCVSATAVASSMGVPWVRAAAPQVLKLGHQFPIDSLPHRMATRLAQQLQDRSGGALTLQVAGGAALGDERKHLSLVKKGLLDFTIAGDLVISGLSNASLVVSLPFLYRGFQHALRTYDSPIGADLRSALLKGGLRTLSWHYVGTRMLTANAPIRQLSQLRGLRLRLPADVAWTALWRHLGADTVHIPFPELGDALRRGVVQAQENPPNFVRTAGLHETQTHLMPTNHMPQRQFVFMADQRWKTLNARQREWVQASAVDVSAWGTEQAVVTHAQDVAWLTEPGRLQMAEIALDGLEPVLRDVAQSLGGSAGVALYERIRAL